MSTPSADPNAVDPPVGRAPVLNPARPFFWSVKRELWEYRSVYLAPAVVGVVVLLASIVGLSRLPQSVRAALAGVTHEDIAAESFGFVATAIAITGLIVAMFYCLGALNNDRRDRSILFWKSLPVSDLLTALSKAFIPLVSIPLVVFAVVLVTQLLILLLSSAVLLANGLSPAMLWLRVPAASLALAYGLTVMSLWFAPVFCWLLLVSAWARRMAFLWATLPLLMVAIVEQIGFGTKYFASLLTYRLTGFYAEAFAEHVNGKIVLNPLEALTPLNFLTTAGLWLGLVCAAVFLVGVVWLRRNREPG